MNTSVNFAGIKMKNPVTVASGTSYEGVKEVTGAVRKVLDKPLIVKLTPNVQDIR